MAYDEILAARIRNLLSKEQGVTEKKMFGGLAFFIYENMSVAASGKGGILVRVDPVQTESLLSSTPATIMVMRGKEMRGWLRISADNLDADKELKYWINLCLDYIRTLPPKSK